MAGGREMHLRSLQSQALNLANSLFLGDYLTSEGQAAQADLEMIADAGFRVLSSEQPVLADRQPEVALRRRGAGTELAPNA
jgi:biotin synthase